MKFIKATYYGVFGTDNLTKEDLGRAKNDKDYILINRISEEYFDAEANEWKPIQGIDKEQAS